MGTNIEIKARLTDPESARATAARLSGGGPEIIKQFDIFFACPVGRLKLRIFGPKSGELIRYQRAKAAGARKSTYVIARTEDPETLREILTTTLGTVGEVEKTRELYLVGQARVHIDTVMSLGEFLEFEVVLRPDQDESDGEKIIRDLLSEFGACQDQFIAEAYVDLISARQCVILLGGGIV